jgi:hypothetical protein
MSEPMHRRRMIITAGLTCIGSVALPLRAPERAAPMPKPTGNTERDTELTDRASAFLSRRYRLGEQVFAFPVSRLQGEFLLGYKKACRLADELQAIGRWTLHYRSDGTRFARILG